MLRFGVSTPHLKTGQTHPEAEHREHGDQHYVLMLTASVTDSETPLRRRMNPGTPVPDDDDLAFMAPDGMASVARRKGCQRLQRPTTALLTGGGAGLPG